MRGNKRNNNNNNSNNNNNGNNVRQNSSSPSPNNTGMNSDRNKNWRTRNQYKRNNNNSEYVSNKIHVNNSRQGSQSPQHFPYNRHRMQNMNNSPSHSHSHSPYNPNFSRYNNNNNIHNDSNNNLAHFSLNNDHNNTNTETSGDDIDNNNNNINNKQISIQQDLNNQVKHLESLYGNDVSKISRNNQHIAYPMIEDSLKNVVIPVQVKLNDDPKNLLPNEVKKRVESHIQGTGNNTPSALSYPTDWLLGVGSIIKEINTEDLPDGVKLLSCCIYTLFKCEITFHIH